MKSLYDSVSYQCSAITTQRYSTSFSLGIRLIEKSLQPHIYALYGFVRFADEIVDTFHDFDKQTLLNRFVADTYLALDEKISLNPILNSFQQTVREFKIDVELINTFIRSMQMDLNPQQYDQANYEQYILGSAEVVGLMCLKIFVNGNEETYQQLKPSAMRLGAVFQKVNFLRDLQFDVKELNRSYFPDLTADNLSQERMSLIFQEIDTDFDEAYKGIVQLPSSSRFGVYLAYRYYRKLFNKIKHTSTTQLLSQRIRIPDFEKYFILLRSYLRHQLNMY
ncbi:MAG: phytoene/squalene synthase family protein [Chitinophagales bacterium]|nr:phytoene/squalene synthase family protein [Chitinophagales bacterium]MBP7534784.1 phytoene/squalene synthase family protein [Chitinophagales bacterium]